MPDSRLWIPLIAMVLIISAILVVVLDLWPWGGERVSLSGTMFVSDAGKSHGGFEYTASYLANLTVTGRKGILILELQVGLGDALQKHRYQVTEFSKSKDQISMKVEASDVILIWTESDIVWNHQYDDYYIASWGSEAPQSEIRGTISPSIFPGLYETYYIELRLR